ncbi:MAG: 5-formyltetrahydrofolate cyclo-ligase [Akkermansia sp.]|nr:5-formyltetrahydrofolate cyclo-ligase [Akkermansia sp.]
MPITKQGLRREALQRLRTAALADPAQLRSAQLRKKLAPLLLEKARSVVAIYAPLPHEINLIPLLREYPQHCYVFPRCLPGRQLQFCHVRNAETDLIPGAMNIPEPAPHTAIITPEEIDILIVPGVAFTRSGARLGYGGGYYDRFIPQCTRARVLALAFEEQLVPDLPTEPHDLLIQELITPLT